MNCVHPGRRPLVAAAATAFALVLLISGAVVRTAAAQESTATTAEIGVRGEAVEVDCSITDPAAQAVTSTVEPASALAIVSEESAARYIAQEELATVGAAEAVGETNAIIGQILFDAEGTPLMCSRFDVDLRTLVSDEARRDNFLYNNTLETAQFPLATFVLTEVEGLDAPLADGEEATFTLIGNLTMHGVTKLVAWEATVNRDGDEMTGTAKTEFNMVDFNIEEPVVGPVVSVDETIALEADITAAAE